MLGLSVDGPERGVQGVVLLGTRSGRNRGDVPLEVNVLVGADQPGSTHGHGCLACCEHIGDLGAGSRLRLPLVVHKVLLELKGFLQTVAEGELAVVDYLISSRADQGVPHALEGRGIRAVLGAIGLGQLLCCGSVIVPSPVIGRIADACGIKHILVVVHDFSGEALRETVVTIHLVGNVGNRRLEITLVDAKVVELVIQLHKYTVLGEADIIRFLHQHDVRSVTADDHLVELGVVVITRNTNLLDLDVWVGLDEVLDGLHLIIPVGDGQRVIGTARGAVRGAAGRGTRQRGDGGDACHQAKGVALHVDVHVVSFLPATTLDFETQL